jgi:hypothetical protein
MVLSFFNHTRVPIDLEAKAGLIVLLSVMEVPSAEPNFVAANFREASPRALSEEPSRFPPPYPDSNHNPRA